MRWIRVIIDKSAVGANAAEVRAGIGYILGGAGAADAASNAGISTCSADVAFPNLLNASVQAWRWRNRTAGLITVSVLT